MAEDGKIKTNALRKEDFIHNELPRLFRAMDVLHLSIEDIAQYYQNHVKSTEKA